MNPLTPDHPLRQTFSRVSHLSEYIKAGLGDAGAVDWITPAELFAPQSPHLATLITATQRRLRSEVANLIGGSLIQE